MAQSIQPDPAGDTKSRIEDKVRALPENQGLNEDEMWKKIDAGRSKISLPSISDH